MIHSYKNTVKLKEKTKIHSAAVPAEAECEK